MLDPDTTLVYLNHAFSGMERVLDRVDDSTVNVRPPDWGTNSIAGLVVHCCELAPSWFEMPGLGRDSERDRDSEFTTEASVAELRERIDRARARLGELVPEFAAGPTALDHDFRAFLPEGDRSDDALVLHVLEELFQHLGHMEVTADALEAG
ncbi:MAG: DinB family protein [Actinomycetota bacterium]